MTKIFNKDCLEAMAELPDNSVDFICSDLPYGLMSYSQDKKINLAKMWQQFKRILKPCASVALFASSRFTFELAASNFEWYKYKWIWLKNYSTLFIHCKNRPMSRYEEILIFSGGKMTHEGKTQNRMKYFPQGLKPSEQPKNHGGKTICLSDKKHGDSRKKFGGTYHASPSNKIEVQKYFINYPTDVLYFDAPYNGNRYHPNQKPVDLLEYLIKTYTQEGELVLDATCGSGSTGVACVNTNRNFIGYETDEKFFEIAKNRVEKAEYEKSARLFSPVDDF